MNQIPISLQFTPVQVGIAPADMNQLGQIIASNLAAYISASVSFFAQGPAVPSAFVTSLFFNTSNGYFYYWDTGSGSYLVQTQFQIGQVISTFNNLDDLNAGWLLLDGRSVTAIQGITARQLAVVQSYFGVTGTLPKGTALTSLNNLPANDSFSDINNPAIAPPTGQIGGLTFSSPPAQTEVQALASNCETLDDSVSILQKTVADVITQSEAMLESLNGSEQTKLYQVMFIGQP